MTAFDLFTIGHSNLPAARFVTLLRANGVDAVADVRSTPGSRFCPWFNAKNLTALLEREGIAYLPYGEALGGRPRDSTLYCDGVADYEAMAQQPEFAFSLGGLLLDASRTNGCVCLLCAERDPLDCHRCLLVGRALAKHGQRIGHILFDGATEPHQATEQRLLALDGEAGDLFAAGHDERLAAAYRRRARAVAYRAKAPAQAATARRTRQ